MDASYLDQESQIPPPAKTVQKPSVQRTSEAAKTSFWLGLSSFILSLLTGIPALIYGVLGLAEVSRSRGHVGGSGLAIAGMVFAAVGSFVPILLLLPAT